jgi:hypothetical protein
MNLKSAVLLVALSLSFQQALRGQAPISRKEAIPTVTFCEMVKHPQLYFDQTIRISSTFEIRTEGSTLNDSLCPRSHDDQIGASAVKIDEKQIRLVNRDFQRIRAGKAGIHPRVTAVGILRNVSRRAFEWYRYRFEIISFENIQPAVSQTIWTPEGALQPIQPSVPTIDFCELVKHPRRYFNRAVRITATWQAGFEYSYLTNDRCRPRASYEIAVGFVVDEAQREGIKRTVDQMMSHEYGGRAIITALGVLRNPGTRSGYFRYLFELYKFEDVAHLVVPYEGMLDAGRTYRAVVRGDEEFGLVLVPPVRIPSHQAVSIEWMNLSEYPALEELRHNSGQHLIVFSVISNEIKQMTERRWDRTLKCRIVRIE